MYGWKNGEGEWVLNHTEVVAPDGRGDVRVLWGGVVMSAYGGGSGLRLGLPATLGYSIQVRHARHWLPTLLGYSGYSYMV